MSKEGHIVHVASHTPQVTSGLSIIEEKQLEHPNERDLKKKQVRCHSPFTLPIRVDIDR